MSARTASGALCIIPSLPPLLLTYAFSSLHTHSDTHLPQILIEMSDHTLAQALQACWSYGSVPFQCGALPAVHTALPQCDLAVCWEKETFNLLPFTADVPSLNLILC